MVNLIESKLEEIKATCVKRSVAELYLFGSAASGSFNINSDIDFAVVFNSSLGAIGTWRCILWFNG